MRFRASFVLVYDCPLTASEREFLLERFTRAVHDGMGIVPGIPEDIKIEEIE